MKLYIENKLMPDNIRDLYQTFEKQNLCYEAACWHWKDGHPGCFLSAIYVKNKDLSEILITTRNYGENPANYCDWVDNKENGKDILNHPAKFEISRVYELPSDHNTLDEWVDKHFGKDNENGSSYNSEIRGFLKRMMIDNDINLQWFSGRYNEFMDYLFKNYKEQFDVVHEILNHKDEIQETTIADEKAN